MLAKTPEQMQEVAESRGWDRDISAQREWERMSHNSLYNYRKRGHDELPGYRTHFLEAARAAFPWLIDLVAIPHIFSAHLYSIHQANGWGRGYLGVVFHAGVYLSYHQSQPTAARKFLKSSEIQVLIQQMIKDVK